MLNSVSISSVNYRPVVTSNPLWIPNHLFLLVVHCTVYVHVCVRVCVYAVWVCTRVCMCVWYGCLYSMGVCTCVCSVGVCTCVCAVLVCAHVCVGVYSMSMLVLHKAS